MKRTKEEADLTRSALIDAAARIFSRDGYDAARLEDIAAMAGVTRGAIAHHFGGKCEIYAELLAAKQAVIEETVKAALAQGGTPGERLKRFIIALLERLEEDENYRRMTELTLICRGGSSDRPSQPSLPSIDKYLKGVSELLAEGVRTGEVRAGIAIPASAKAILGLISGISLLWLMSPDSFSIKAEAPEIVNAFLAGMLQPAASQD